MDDMPLCSSYVWHLPSNYQSFIYQMKHFTSVTSVHKRLAMYTTSLHQKKYIPNCSENLNQQYYTTFPHLLWQVDQTIDLFLALAQTWGTFSPVTLGLTFEHFELAGPPPSGPWNFSWISATSTFSHGASALQTSFSATLVVDVPLIFLKVTFDNFTFDEVPFWYMQTKIRINVLCEHFKSLM